MIKVEIPKWTPDDPFGRNALKGVCYELKKALCEKDALRVELEETLKCQGRAVDRISSSLSAEQIHAKELDRRLQISEEARKSLGDKNRALRDDLDKMTGERAKLRIELERLKELHNALLKEHDALQEEHEKLVRGLTDKEAAEV